MGGLFCAQLFLVKVEFDLKMELLKSPINRSQKTIKLSVERD
jgi:hypothetical protein